MYEVSNESLLKSKLKDENSLKSWRPICRFIKGSQVKY